MDASCVLFQLGLSAFGNCMFCLSWLIHGTPSRGTIRRRYYNRRHDNHRYRNLLNYEKLESRLLLATVSGDIFFDANRNGIRDDVVSEPGMPGITARWSGSFDNPLSGNIVSDVDGGYELLNVTDANLIAAISALAGVNREVTGPLALAESDSSVDLTTQTRPTWLASGRIDAGDTVDLVVTNTGSDSLSLFFNQGDGTFTTTTLSVGDAPKVVLVEDLNLDGFVDLAVTYKNSPFVTLLVNDGAGGFANRTDLPTTEAVPSIVLVDMDGDLDLDLVGVRPTTSDLLTWQNNSANAVLSFPTAPSLTPTTFAAAMVVGAQLDDDQAEELLLLDATSNFVVRYDHIGASLFQPNGSVSIDPGVAGVDGDPLFIAAGDLNGDERDDLVVSRFRDRKISLYFNNGGQFGPSDQQDLFAEWYPIGLAIADVDSDGDVDVVVNTYNSPPGVLVNDGGNVFTDAGTFGNNVSFATALLGPPVVADFNEDGVVDFAYSKRPNAIFSVDVDFVELDEGKYIIRTTTDSSGLDFGVAPTVSLGSTVGGDYNGDLVVDVADLGVWEANFGAVSGPGTSADGNQNDIVDGGDFLLWQRNFSPTSVAAVSVAEDSQTLVALDRSSENVGDQTRNSTNVFFLTLNTARTTAEKFLRISHVTENSIQTDYGFEYPTTERMPNSEFIRTDIEMFIDLASSRVTAAETSGEADLPALDEFFTEVGGTL